MSDGSDEEITSEEEDGGSDKSRDGARNNHSPAHASGEGSLARAEQEARRKRKLKEYPALVAKRHKAFSQFRWDRGQRK